MVLLDVMSGHKKRETHWAAVQRIFKRGIRPVIQTGLLGASIVRGINSYSLARWTSAKKKILESNARFAAHWTRDPVSD